MIYYTGDIHGSASKITKFCTRFNISSADTVVILGDVGANYWLDDRDQCFKTKLNSLGTTILCIHGNHEIRPSNVSTYCLKEWHGGSVWFEQEYPNILFAKDGDIHTIEGIAHLVIGGAYSVDKYYRLSHGYGWWNDEQPSFEVKSYVEQQIAGHSFDIILSHTCPLKYEPTEAFLPAVDQSTVDNSTELWLDSIEEVADYKAWFCGHWHIDKRIDKIHFLYHGFESSEQFIHSKESSS